MQAFRLGEALSMPVMVCMDGFILTHAFETRRPASQEQVDRYLPPYEPRQVLDPEDPVTIGAMVGPEAFTEVRWLAHAKQMQALQLIPALAEEFRTVFGRDSGGLVRPYRCEDAHTIVVALGSVLGTLKDTIDELRDAGEARGRARHHVVTAVSARAGAHGAAGSGPRGGAGEEPGRGPGRHRVDRRAHGAVGIHLHGSTVIAAWAGGRSRARACTGCCARRSPTARAAALPRPRTAGWSTRCWRARPRSAAPARSPRASCATWARTRRASAEHGQAMARRPDPAAQAVKFYQTGTFTVGNRLLGPEHRSVQAGMARSNALDSGHGRARAAAEALGARYALDAAMAATAATP